MLRIQRHWVKSLRDGTAPETSGADSLKTYGLVSRPTTRPGPAASSRRWLDASGADVRGPCHDAVAREDRADRRSVRHRRAPDLRAGAAVALGGRRARVGRAAARRRCDRSRRHRRIRCAVHRRFARHGNGAGARHRPLAGHRAQRRGFRRGGYEGFVGCHAKDGGRNGATSRAPVCLAGRSESSASVGSAANSCASCSRSG